MKEKVLVIAGPTAVGRTDLSVKLAKKLNGEIISTDSVQIYKYMGIGSAKITEEEMCDVPHHMIDVVDPSTPFSVADYKEMAQKYIDDIISRGKLPVLTSGTELYINTLTCNMNFTEAENDLKYKSELEKLAEKHGNEYIHGMLKDIDPVSYKEVHYNNRKRVIRALEVYKLTKRPFSSFNAGGEFYNGPYDVTYYVLNMDRGKLYNGINLRVDMMMDKGLLEECIKLKEMRYNSSVQSIRGIGYKEIFYYLENKISLNEAVEMIKEGSRNYAERQLAWFRRDPRAVILDKDIFSEDEIFKRIVGEFLP